MIEVAQSLCRLDETRLRDGLQGIYLRQYGLILLDSRLCDMQRRCVLAHEISHARHLDAGCRWNKWSERRADMEAAAMLIDPVEYAAAEILCEGNLVSIAHELDVLPWVVHAYRERLHDDPSLVLQ